MNYGMTATEVRQAAYKMAVQNNLNIPESWTANQCAGMEWFLQLRLRNPSLSLRKPEKTSLSRATAFNRTNVADFFTNLENVLMKYPELADGTRIFNLDEIALTTVQSPQKVLAGKESRRLNKLIDEYCYVFTRVSHYNIAVSLYTTIVVK